MRGLFHLMCAADVMVNESNGMKDRIECNASRKPAGSVLLDALHNGVMTGYV